MGSFAGPLVNDSGPEIEVLRRCRKMRAAVAFLALVVSTLVGGRAYPFQEWTPPQSSVLGATRAIERYFSLLDNGDSKRAYEMMSDAANVNSGD